MHTVGRASEAAKPSGGLVGAAGFEPATCRLSGATGYKSAALPLSYAP